MENKLMTRQTGSAPAEGRENAVAQGRASSPKPDTKTPEILFITSYPPRECGIATYSQDLIQALTNQFTDSFNIKICAVENISESYDYKGEVKYTLNTDDPNDFLKLAKKINEDQDISVIVLQHEFGFFAKNAASFQAFIYALSKPILTVFHTILPHPTHELRLTVQEIVRASQGIIVMTYAGAKILTGEYGVEEEMISIIPHGTHLVNHLDRNLLKQKYDLQGRTILSTFGLLSSGKSIETTLRALPEIIRHNKNNDLLFLIIGITHPGVVKREGEKYRQMLEEIIDELDIKDNVRFINKYLSLPELLEYLQLTDIYLFTSNDPNQAVSGTFSYAISCGCTVISTPIPHALEVLGDDAGIIIDFGNSGQLATAVNKLMNDTKLKNKLTSNGLHKMASTVWENAALSHAILFRKSSKRIQILDYTNPVINLNHIKRMTTDFAMIQFSKIDQPDIDSGYTLDDNARAMVALCQHYELTRDEQDLGYIKTYLTFIGYCLTADGYFLNYVDEKKEFTQQNNETNLADSNGRAVWALGYLTSLAHVLPKELVIAADFIIESVIDNVSKIHSTRAMAFVIKGLYYRDKLNNSPKNILIIRELANRLVQMYRHEASDDWQWFEAYLTYANSTLPEALLCAWLATGDITYKETAKKSFDFLLSNIFIDNHIKVISNKGWLHKGDNISEQPLGGEQPIDVAYTVLALDKFNRVFVNEGYDKKIKIAFSWFLGNNHLNQIIYNPCTGGCYDGLEENYVNLNQGAESTVSYLMARLTIEKSLAKN